MTILDGICPRLVDASPESVLALEILDGPYKGVVYSYSKFTVLDTPGPDGMASTRFETTIHTAPPGFAVDESFDAFCADVLVEWIAYCTEDAERVH